MFFTNTACVRIGNKAIMCCFFALSPFENLLSFLVEFVDLNMRGTINLRCIRIFSNFERLMVEILIRWSFRDRVYSGFGFCGKVK